MSDLDSECMSCYEEGMETCPNSKRQCGHHCNHSWSHEECCWCNWRFIEMDLDPLDLAEIIKRNKGGL